MTKFKIEFRWPFGLQPKLVCQFGCSSSDSQRSSSIFQVSFCLKFAQKAFLGGLVLNHVMAKLGCQIGLMRKSIWSCQMHSALVNKLMKLQGADDRQLPNLCEWLIMLQLFSWAFQRGILLKGTCCSSKALARQTQASTLSQRIVMMTRG